MRHHLFALLIFGVFSGAVVTAAAGQENSSRPSWDCLPGSTAMALRFPNGQAFVDEFQRTKLGSVVLNNERTELVQQMLADDERWSTWIERLREYGLDPQDLIRCLAGETGFAAVVDNRDDEPLWIGLGWLESGPERSNRLREALLVLIENQEDAEHPIRRIDIEIDDREVIMLRVPWVRDVYAEEVRFPDNLQEMSDDERHAAIQEARGAAEASKETKIRYSHLLLTSAAGRILVATTLEAVEEADPDRRINRLTRVFADFLAAHQGEPGEFVARVESTPGLAAVLPQGVETFFEFYGDIRPLVELATQYADPQRKLDQTLHSLGIDQVGVAAVRTSLDGSLMSTGVFIEAPAPRRGIVGILDQPQLEPVPPAWVPASVIEYEHVSLDLGKLYAQVKQIVTSISGEVAEMSFQRAEAMVEQVANADLASILSSLGHRHTMISFEPRMREVQTPDGESASVLSERAGMVWRIQDEELWNRLLQAAQAYAAMAGDAVKFEKVQGFEGYRLTSEAMEGGLFLGKGYLVLAVGEEVVDQLLALINNPPTGSQALRNSDAFRRAVDLLRLESGQGFDFADTDRYAGVLSQSMEQVLENPGLVGAVFARPGADPRVAERLSAQLRRLMPSRDELQNMLGVSVGYRRVTDRGLEMRSVSELPR